VVSPTFEKLKPEVGQWVYRAHYMCLPSQKLCSLPIKVPSATKDAKGKRIDPTEHSERFESKDDPLLCISLVSSTPSTGLIQGVVHQYVLGDVSPAMCGALRDGER
jgi:hypothetical protein